MLSQSNIKFIKKLELKKYRKQNNCFVVEGEKMVKELALYNVKIVDLFATEKFITENISSFNNDINVVTVTNEELKKVSNLKTPNEALAIVNTPKNTFNKITNELAICLDNVQDPGNLGTIIRTAVWFGIKKIYCSLDTVDAYNSKVIQSTMGAIFNVDIYYTDLVPVLEDAKKNDIAIFGTHLKGENIYTKQLPQNALIVMGNESKGLSDKISEMVTQKVLIPSFLERGNEAESLNVSIATAIVCSEFKRNSVN